MNPKLRNMTATYLSQNGKMLLLYRVGSRVVAPSWCGIGGHFEEYELNDPRACALRELREETGLTEAQLENFNLRYVTLRLKNGEIRQNYYFFADLKPAAILPAACDEGRLAWVGYGELLEKEMPYTAKTVLRHYLAEGSANTRVYGSVTTCDGGQFIELADF